MHIKQIGKVALGVIIFWSLVSPERYFFPGFVNGADSASYVAYAMSIALDGDLEFSNEIAAWLTTYPNGQVRPVHPPGPGIMAAPFVAVLSLGDRLSGHAVIEDRTQLGGSWSYFGYFLASMLAFFLGLFATITSARAVSKSLSPKLLAVILAGTGLPYYGLTQFSMGHSFEFFAAGLVLWSVVRLRRIDRGPFGSMLLLGAGVAFSLLVRPANINIVLLPALVHLVLELASRATRPPEVRQYRAAWLAGGTALGLSGAFGTNTFLYGTAYPSFGLQYRSPRVDVGEAISSASSPTLEPSNLGLFAAATEFLGDTIPRALTAMSRFADIPTVLLTQEYGLLWFMPIVPLGGLLLVASLFVLWHRNELRWTIAIVAVLTTAYVAVPLGVVLIWQSHGSSFGFRYLFSLVPLGLLGLALWSVAHEQARIRPFRPVLRFLALLATFSLLGQLFHGADSTLVLRAVGENSFGRSVSSGNPTFATSLLLALLRPEAWANMLARGFPGFVAIAFLPVGTIHEIGALAGIVPYRRADTLLDLVTSYRAILESSAPGTVMAVWFVLGILAPAIFAWIMRQDNMSGPTFGAGRERKS